MFGPSNVSGLIRGRSHRPTGDQPAAATHPLARPALALALALGTATGVAGVSAQDATPGSGTPVPDGAGLPANCTVVAEGLLNPRHLVLGEDGTLYISEAGIGGTEEGGSDSIGTSEIGTPAADNARVDNSIAGGTPEPDTGDVSFADSTRGYTGQVSIVTADGTQSVLSDGFVSYSDGVGPTGLALSGTTLYVAVGGTGVIGGLGSVEGENAVFAVDVTTGAQTILADPGAYEVENNPDGTDVNPNLNSLGLGPDGLLYTVDAGGNVIYTIDPATGALDPTIVFPTLEVLLGDLGATPVAGDEETTTDRQLVPTDIAFTVDGDPIVSFLSETWPAGAPSVVSIVDGEIVSLAEGLSAVVAIQPGPDAALYATQLSSDLETFAPGSVVRIDVETGEQEVVLDGLTAPYGSVFDAAGGMYLITDAVSFGPEPNGQVIYCEGVAEVDATAATGTTAGSDILGVTRP
ncbi:MAG TPA: ScyD/ScyE family protein [Thermomicrobiales bacterium]|jgi:hypothetical protein|nr:ScyD/ScyE family protein [Thermomicrobiales bacterium]